MTAMSRLIRIAMAFAAPLLLTGCLFTPGKFLSEMDVAADGSFTFSYTGEIVVPGLGGLSPGSDSVENLRCYGPVTTPDTMSTADAPPAVEGGEPGAERACTEAERTAYAAQVQRDSRSGNEFSLAARQILGFDPAAPESIDLIISRLKRQKGWKSATYKGKGVFEVDYAIAGMLDRDFVFPVYPKASAIFPMVIATRAADGTVTISAPGFGGPGGPGAAAAMIEGMDRANLAGRAATSQTDGSFTILSAAAIISTNAPGSTGKPKSRRMVWTVTPTSQVTPTAALKPSR